MAGRSNQESKKSLIKAYILLFFGGFFGLHHFYLHRSRQCFIYLITFGGYLGLGLIRDLWRLPEYVKDFNYDRDYAIQLKSKARSRSSPASNFFREIIKISIGNMFGYFVILCIPQEKFKIDEYRLNIIAMCLAPLGSAIGVHLAGNIGRHAGKLRHAIVGAYITCPLYYFFGIHQVFWSSLLAKYFFNRKLSWRLGPLRSNRAWYTRIFMITVSFTVFAAMVGSFVYFNCVYQDEYGNNIKCREAGLNFLSSPAVRDYQQAMRDLKNYIQAYGLKGIWNEIMEQFDFGGETNALSVLNLTESADEKEIRATYHKLSRKWHPDRYKDPKAQREAQDIYIQIQKAYETLSQTKIKRLKKNMRTDDGSGHSYDEL